MFYISKRTVLIGAALHLFFFAGSGYLAWKCHRLSGDLADAKWQVKIEQDSAEFYKKQNTQFYIDGFRDGREQRVPVVFLP